MEQVLQQPAFIYGCLITTFLFALGACIAYICIGGKRRDTDVLMNEKMATRHERKNN